MDVYIPSNFISFLYRNIRKISMIIVDTIGIAVFPNNNPIKCTLCLVDLISRVERQTVVTAYSEQKKKSFVRSFKPAVDTLTLR